LARREWFKPQKDFLQRNRTKIVYGTMVLALLASLAGWALLPDKVAVFAGTLEDELRDKNVTLLAHLGMVSLFSALFWKWPREWAYLLGIVITLMLMASVLVNTLGVI